MQNEVIANNKVECSFGQCAYMLQGSAK